MHSDVRVFPTSLFPIKCSHKSKNILKYGKNEIIFMLKFVATFLLKNVSDETTSLPLATENKHYDS